MRWLIHWPTQASLATIVAAVAVSVGVGIVFGFYPAWKASRLDPIEACGTSSGASFSSWLSEPGFLARSLARGPKASIPSLVGQVLTDLTEGSPAGFRQKTSQRGSIL